MQPEDQLHQVYILEILAKVIVHKMDLEVAMGSFNFPCVNNEDFGVGERLGGIW